MEKTINNLEVEIVPYDPLENRKWGFSNFSEKINGRLAMLGFTFLLVFEFFTKQKITELFNQHINN